MRVAILGDTHANFSWIWEVIDCCEDLGLKTIIQVGDLGVTSNMREAERWNKVNRHLQLRGMQMLVAPGNHEDYDRIALTDTNVEGWQPFRSEILLASRGQRTSIGGRSFVWLGGAGSVDRTLRQEWHARDGKRYWWPGEAVTVNDIERAVAGGHADVFISHDAPTGIPDLDLRLRRSASQWNSDDLRYAEALRELFTKAVEGVSPDWLFHGHFHWGYRSYWKHPETGKETIVVGMGMDNDRHEGLGVLDLDEMRFEWVSIPHKVRK